MHICCISIISMYSLLSGKYVSLAVYSIQLNLEHISIRNSYMEIICVRIHDSHLIRKLTFKLMQHLSCHFLLSCLSLISSIHDIPHLSILRYSQHLYPQFPDDPLRKSPADLRFFLAVVLSVSQPYQLT